MDHGTNQIHTWLFPYFPKSPASFLIIQIVACQLKQSILLVFISDVFKIAKRFVRNYAEHLTLNPGRAINACLTHFILETPKGVLAKSEDPDQMPHDVASDLGLHYFASCSAIFQQKFSINIT